MTDKQQHHQKRIYISIDKLKPGTKIAQDIEYKFGGILLPSGTIMDKNKIKRIQKLDLQNVYVFDEAEETIRNNIEKIENIEHKYKKSMDKMSSVFKKVRTKKEIKYEDVFELTDEVTNIGNENDLLNLLTKIRNVDQYTYSHSLNVGILAYIFGNWLNLKDRDCIKLTQAGLIHDIGKAYISDKILNKPAKLTAKEYEEMKKHSIYGYKMVKDVDFISRETAEGSLTHHERFDGSGYPLGLVGRKIPLFGRILGIVDTFDAITADRIYQPSSSPFKAIKIFKEKTFALFDYKLLKIFLDKIPNYFVNEYVRLNDGRKAEIIYINPNHPDKPIVKIDNNYIDLYNNSDLKINKILS